MKPHGLYGQSFVNFRMREFEQCVISLESEHFHNSNKPTRGIGQFDRDHSS